MIASQTITICITGAGGQIAYSLIPQLLSGNAFGSSTQINLRLLDIPQSMNVVRGVIMQIIDCTFPLLLSVEQGDNPEQMFKNADVIIFLGGFPRKPGMQRKDLLMMNKDIFIRQGQALKYANQNVHCLVVANPANTNAFILSKHAPSIPKQNITCLSRLDHNRALGQIALKTKSKLSEIEGIMIFGNHSLTQYPAIKNITVKQKPIDKKVERYWLQKTFVPKVQKRGGQILQTRGGSSVFSAAKAIIDHLKDWFQGSNKIISMGIVSQGHYNIPKGLWCSFPVKCNKEKPFTYTIIDDIQLSQYCKQMIAKSYQELENQIKDAGLQLKSSL